MVSDIIKIIASKYNATETVASIITDINSKTNMELSLPIQRSSVFYLLEYSGNSNSPDVKVEIKDRGVDPLLKFEEFPDYPVEFDYIPFLKKAFRDKLVADLTNNSDAKVTVTFVMRGITIDEFEKEKFEKELFEVLGVKPK